MDLYIFDDRTADGWRPFALTRPCAELRYGRLLLRERLERFAGVRARAHLTRAWLGDFSEPGAPPVLERGGDTRRGDLLYLISRFVPAHDGGFVPPPPGPPALLVADGQVVGIWAPDGTEPPDGSWLEQPQALPGIREIELEGQVLCASWDLVGGNAERLARDLDAAPVSPLPDHAYRIGSGPVSLGDGVRIEPGVLIDTRNGGVRLDDGVEVRAGARLAGPLHAGPGTRLLGGPFEAVSAGPRCNLRGEMEETVVLGYANKAHDGFLGHAYLGHWVNLGALTTNSDLKNNYGEVRIGGPDGETGTGLLKLGCLVGDHVKSAIGTMINTGTVIGAGANLFGDARPPKWVPPFAWGHEPGAPAYDRDRFVETAVTVMRRRQLSPDEGVRRWLAACWEQGRAGEPG